MAYTPINWQNGDTITAAKMNKMDNGWSVESSSTELCSESVTTAVGQDELPEAVLSSSAVITADSIIVTLNGTDYTCPKQELNGQYYYGGFDTESMQPDFSTYPFFLWSDSGTNTIYTENAGSYTVVIVASSTTAEISDDFATAVGSFIDINSIPFRCISGQTTQADIVNARSNGRIAYFVDSLGSSYFLSTIGYTCTFYPEDETLTATIDRNTRIFVVTES